MSPTITPGSPLILFAQRSLLRAGAAWEKQVCGRSLTLPALGDTGSSPGQPWGTGLATPLCSLCGDLRPFPLSPSLRHRPPPSIVPNGLAAHLTAQTRACGGGESSLGPGVHGPILSQLRLPAKSWEECTVPPSPASVLFPETVRPPLCLNGTLKQGPSRVAMMSEHEIQPGRWALS